MVRYSFVTHWELDAPVETVWELIRNMDAWPQWWNYVRSVTLIKSGDENDIGSVRRIVWNTALPYTIEFDSELVYLEKHKKLEGRAFGELTGKGLWTFENNNGKTNVRYDWEVVTTRRWMNLLAPIAKPIFKWNHDKVMKGGYAGIKKMLGVGG